MMACDPRSRCVRWALVPGGHRTNCRHRMDQGGPLILVRSAPNCLYPCEPHQTAFAVLLRARTEGPGTRSWGGRRHFGGANPGWRGAAIDPPRDAKRDRRSVWIRRSLDVRSVRPAHLRSAVLADGAGRGQQESSGKGAGERQEDEPPGIVAGGLGGITERVGRRQCGPGRGATWRARCTTNATGRRNARSGPPSEPRSGLPSELRSGMPRW